MQINSANNRVGGTASAQRNVISGNQGTGVFITGAGATGNVVQGNYIGTDLNGTSAVPNTQLQSGVLIQNGAIDQHDRRRGRRGGQRSRLRRPRQPHAHRDGD